MKIISRIFLILLLFIVIASIRPVSSYAWWHGHGYVVIGGPGPYYYGYPYYYSPYYYPDPGYTVVSSPSFQPVVINGTTYYLNNGSYYLYTQYGYQAVSTPAGAAVTQPTSAATVDTDDEVTVNIPNSKGGYTPVLIKRSGKGFVGPQGEFYTDFPKVSQLQVIYGK